MIHGGTRTLSRQLPSAALLDLVVPPRDSSSWLPPGHCPGPETSAHSLHVLSSHPSSPAPLTPKWPFWWHTHLSREKKNSSWVGGAGLKMGDRVDGKSCAVLLVPCPALCSASSLLCPNTVQGPRGQRGPKEFQIQLTPYPGPAFLPSQAPLDSFPFPLSCRCIWWGTRMALVMEDPVLRSESC